jgi:hypothetical protein
MFGLILAMLKGACRFASAINDSVEDKKSREDFTSEDGIYYMDHRGELRLSTNGRRVAKTTTFEGDEVLTDLVTSEIYVNYTQEKAEKEQRESIEAQKKYGGTTICLGLERNYAHYIGKGNPPKGARFKDVKTGAIYVIRQIDGMYTHYVDVNTGKVVRLTDCSKQFWHEGNREIYWGGFMTIEEFNKNFSGLDPVIAKWSDIYDIMEEDFHKGK